MITKEIFQKYVFNKPNTCSFIYGILVITGVFLSMILTVTFLENELLLIGFISGGILLGISLTLTRNVFFPIGIILFYNLTLTFLNNQLPEVSAELLFTVISRGIGDALFICFVIYWNVIFAQYLLAWFKKLPKVSDEPITTPKFIIGSVIAGSLYGIFMVIQII